MIVTTLAEVPPKKEGAEILRGSIGAIRLIRFGIETASDWNSSESTSRGTKRSSTLDDEEKGKMVHGFRLCSLTEIQTKVMSRATIPSWILGPVWSQKLRRLVNLMRLLLLLGLSSVVQSASIVLGASPQYGWERTSDARAVIVVKGVRLALPVEGKDGASVSFNDWSNIKHMSLRTVIESPTSAREMFSKASLIDIHFSNGQDEGPFLEKFDRSELRSFAADIVIGEKAQSNCLLWKKEADRLSSAAATEKQKEINNGWFEVNNASKAGGTVFLRKSEANYRGLSTLLSCDPLEICHASRCIGSNIGMTFQFARHAVPVGRWDRINRLALELAEFVLMGINN